MRDTLVLNASFEPLSTVSLKRAVVLVMQDKAVVEQAHPGLRMRAAAVDMPVPRVIRLCRYVRVPFRRRAPWSRRGVLVRDRHRCAYCGRRATTVDHVVPRSQGGQDTWLNTVASCAEDNHRKADRTPEQAGMPLLRQPFEPTPADAMLLALGLTEDVGRRCRTWLAAAGADAAASRRGRGAPALRGGARLACRAASVLRRGRGLRGAASVPRACRCRRRRTAAEGAEVAEGAGRGP